MPIAIASPVRLRVGAAYAALSLAACAGAPAKPAAPLEPQPPITAPKLAPDLSEVPAPARLAALVRWRTPQATLDTIYQWTGIRLSAPDLAAQAYDRGLAETLAYDAPVDAAVAIEAPQQGERDVTPQVAVAFGVRSLDAARRAAQAVGTVTEGAAGEYRIRLKASKRHGEKAFCLLTPAAGTAPARLVCGQRERDVDALAPYMARTLPRRDLGAADVHVELHAPPMVDAYGPALNQGLRLGAAYLPRKAQIGEPVFDRALERAASAVAEELGSAAKDLDAITFDVALLPEQATVDATLKMRTQLSWTAGTLASQASRAAEAPPQFWRLPKTSSAAGYWYPPDPARLAEIRHTLSELVDGWLLHEGLAPADRVPLVTLFSDKFVFDTPIVSGSGTFADTAPSSGAPTAAKDAGAENGWYLSGFAGPAPIGEMLKALVAGVNRPKVQALLKTHAARMASADPEAKPRPSAPLPMTVRSVPPPKGLPAGSLDFEVTIARELMPGRGAPGAVEPSASGAKSTNGGSKAVDKAAPAAKMHLLVISSPKETWTGLAWQRDKLATAMLGALEGAKNAETLATRADLEPMHDGRFVSASFSTLEGILRSWRSPLVRALEAGGGAKRLDEARASLETAPHKGLTPMRFTSTISTEGTPTTHLHLHVPKGVIDDAIIIAASSLMQGLGRP